VPPKQLIALLVVLVLAAGAGVLARQRPEKAATWKSVWGDEFDGQDLDRSKWNARDKEARDIDLGCNVDSPANALVKDGYLTLRALKQTVDCGGHPRHYTEPYLDTRGKASWTYGRFEIRAKSPNGPDNSQGLWPAFWMKPDGGGNGEIDIVELPGGAKWHDRPTAAIFWDYTPVKQDVRLAMATKPGDGFHTYAVEWEPGALRWYVDGVLAWARDRGTTPWFDKAFSRNYHLRLNFQVGGWLGDPTPQTTFPADFVVDYVRVYQR
jgi:beta-glucanase (GH16 family)